MRALQNCDVDAVSALFAGVFCAALFNPWDRAMYLASGNNTAFFLRKNFSTPFHGFMQAIIQRAFVYLFLQAKLEHIMKPYLRDELGMSESLARFCVGLFAGCINGAVVNPMIAVKHYTWGNKNRSFYSSARDMWLQGGYKSFLNGMHASMMRGMVFGATYEILRTPIYDALKTHATDWNNTQLTLIANLISAGAGTIAASPFIYMRSIQHATKPGCKPLTMRAQLKNKWAESKSYPSILGKLVFFPRTFRTFPGTAGAAARMAVAQQICDGMRSVLKEDSAKHNASPRLK